MTKRYTLLSTIKCKNKSLQRKWLKEDICVITTAEENNIEMIKTIKILPNCINKH